MIVLAVTTGAYAWLIGPALQFLLSGGEHGFGAVGRLLSVLGQVDRARALWLLPVVVVAIGLVKGVAYLAQFYWMGLYGQRISVDLRRALFLVLARLSPMQLSAQRSGDLLSRFSTDVAAVELAATYAVASYLRDSVQVVVLAAVAFSLNWKVALATMVIIPVAAWPVARMTRSFMKRSREGQKGLGLMAAQVQEGIWGLRTVQAFNAQRAERERFAVQAERQVRALIRAAWVRGGVPGLMEVLAAAVLAGVLGFAAGTHAIPPDQLVSLLTAIVLVYQPVKDLGRVSQFVLQAQVAGERLFAVLDGAPAVADAPGARELPAITRGVRVEDLHFAWGDRPALCGLTLEIPAGRTTAIVGPSGGGKSTLVAMLLRFERPDSGRILFDGVDAAEATVASVRRQFALVTQEPLLFAATIAENIRFGRPSATDDEVVAAARIADADGFIRALPEGYQTRVGERGVRLSGGQKQRVCLARAILAGAPVLVLDEATSSLDPESEQEVQRALERVLVGRTAVVIAHRLATIQRADRIYVLENGRVAQSGTHEELLASGGLYAKLWALQNAPERAEASVA
ncbi:MAG: ABC transporter ATP-binding protein [Myxococcaceae bacterium]|nr:ABC transporter ATP-binding protein [Myxococcaceae bacterium]